MATEREMRRQYLRFHRDVTEILSRHDPVGLLRLGAPGDEYEPEVGTIIPRLKTANGPDDVRRIFQEEFMNCFGAEEIAGPESAYDTIAEEIWHSLVKGVF